MIFNLFDKDGLYVNGIKASLEFVQDYCAEHNYTFSEEIRDPATAYKNSEVNNANPEAKIQAISDRQDFLEDCIAEMAMQIYN